MTTAPTLSRRAKFPDDLLPLRETLEQLVPILEAGPGWYGSVYFERKAACTYTANLKQTNVADQFTSGAVLRVYDGVTLYERATDELNPASLRNSALDLARSVERARTEPTAPRRPYRPPAWADRLSAPLDPEIRTQVPKNVTARTPVHFGIRFREDPTAPTPEEHLKKLSGILDACRKGAADAKLPGEGLTYVMARQQLAVEESIFIDRESNLSQTLYRLALTVVTMSGEDRTYCRQGGLGGLEAIELSEADLVELIDDLSALKSADRLVPGKHRVLLGPVVTGVLAHEAFGHAQEGDTCARGRSKAWELHHSGEKVGNVHATILNNPAIFENGGKPYAAWGSYFFDEEGWLAQEQVLLDRGVLKAPMTNLTSALRLGVPRTANGKRESWANGVYTRQTNTYFSPGDRTLDELMAEMGDGYLAVHPAGGMEDPKGMGIQVGVSFLKEVKGGKLTGKVLKGPAGGDIQLTGYVPDVLRSIIAKSKIDATHPGEDVARHPFNDAGGCGKYHKEFVYAGCGGPYLLLGGVVLG